MTPGQAVTPKKVIVNPPLKESSPSPVVKTPKSRIVTPKNTTPQTVQQQIAPNSATNTITVGPDQQQVFYTVSGEDGKTQQYMMLCPKDMDQNTLITTLVRQISADPTNKGKKTIRITQHKSTPNVNNEVATKSTPQSAPSRGTNQRGRGRGSANSTPKTSRQSLPSGTDLNTFL